MRQQKDVTYEVTAQLKDAGAIAASAAAQVGGSAKVYDLGLGRVDFRVIVDVSAITVAGATNESYLVLFQLSNSPTFANTVINGVALFLGGIATTQQSAATTIGRYEIGACNEINGVLFRYGRMFTVIVGGTAPSINYTAYIGVEA